MAVSQSELFFVGGIKSPVLVLAAIERGHAAVAAAGDSELALGLAVAGTWIEIAKLEDDYTASTVCDNVWPKAAAA